MVQSRNFEGAAAVRCGISKFRPTQPDPLPVSRERRKGEGETVFNFAISKVQGRAGSNFAVSNARARGGRNFVISATGVDEQKVVW